jgi:hypothetical protein
MRTFVLPYKQASNAARDIATSLGVKRLRLENSKYVPRNTDLVINWGSSSTPFQGTVGWLNKPEELIEMTNKLKFFQRMSQPNQSNPRIPEWTQSHKEAKMWIADGKTVVARTKLTGHSGEGIVLIDKDNENQLDALPSNTLLVKYIPKKDEFRIHFSKLTDCFDIQKKLLSRESSAGPYPKIRSHTNGFIYSRNDIGTVPKDVYDQAKLAKERTSLDFGAIDVMYNRLREKATVLEINTAPGLQGTTLENYTRELNKLVQEHKNT